MEPEVYNPAIIDLNTKVSPAILSTIFGVNVSLIYQEVQKGRIPPLANLTYIQAIQAYLNYFKKNAEVRVLREQEEIAKRKEKLEYAQKLKEAKVPKSSSDDGDMHPLMAAKLTQNIKTERAREAQLWQKIAIERGEFISFAEKLSIVEPFIMAIRDTLLYIGNNFPETQEKIDESMLELEELGKSLLEDAIEDSNNYITTMLNLDIDENIEEVSLNE